MAWPKTFRPANIIEKLKQKIASLQQQWRSTRREIERLRKENEQSRRREKQLEREQEQLRQEQERLRQENQRLKRQLEEAQRANKRQAAPFSRGQRKANPKPPGRKPGTAYGQRLSVDVRVRPAIDGEGREQLAKTAAPPPTPPIVERPQQPAQQQ